MLTAGGINVVALTSAAAPCSWTAGRATGAALRGAVAKLPGSGPIHTLFNTHWHREQTGSNETLGQGRGHDHRAGEHAALALDRRHVAAGAERRSSRCRSPARPNRPRCTRRRARAGSQDRSNTAHLRHAAHTDGDLYVFFPEDNVLAAGAVTSAGWQAPDWWTGGWIGGVVGGLEHRCCRLPMQRRDRSGARPGDEQSRISRRSSRCTRPCGSASRRC